ncbi:DinB family protein [Panacibacter sp. DH6]|uniref:DinB family protein n=1 Tax=Panacibacter microcysteis TaxID=2793269 RepID=A0A931E2D9_9BACT|nr:DinB family protein [Panacibacter microcysteis]MBG9374867.1 DinB family protein [Panacibacter microcysteis]
MAEKSTEYWLRGPVADIPALLQPVAHALLQARAEVNEMMTGFDAGLLFSSIAGMASPAFHLLHLAGVLDRLFTYARGEQLTEKQLDYLNAETNPDKNIVSNTLLANFNMQVNLALEQLKHTDASTLTAVRAVGRKHVPSTVIGLLVHAAEHTMRHTGQLLVTVNALTAYSKEK